VFLKVLGVVLNGLTGWRLLFGLTCLVWDLRFASGLALFHGVKCHKKGNDIGRNDIGKVSFERSAAVDCGRSLRERAPFPSEATEAISGSNNTPTGCSDAINSKVPASKEDKQNNHS
jgi:hypothetical protein